MLGGKSKGFGFVHYVTDEAADKAIELLKNAAYPKKYNEPNNFF